MLSALALGASLRRGVLALHTWHISHSHTVRGVKAVLLQSQFLRELKKQIYSVVGAVGNGIPTYEQGCARFMSRESNLTQL